MEAFARLLDRLILTPSRNAKLRLLGDYFGTTTDPDRGWALAALTGTLDLPSVKPAMLRAMVMERIDPVLFGYSYDYVGDLAETISLVWQDSSKTDRRDAAPAHSPSLSAVVETLLAASRSEGPRRVAAFLDALDPAGRWALLKLVTGGLRIGVSARLAKQALADRFARDVGEIEEVWHSLKPPYAPLFAWLAADGERPVAATSAPFRPVMLAQPLEAGDRPLIVPQAYAAEWKWDGIRVQAVSDGGVRRLYSRSGEDIGDAFPDVLEGLDVEGALDGELLVGRPAEGRIVAGTFSELQQRLNRKSVTGKLVISHPAFIRAYDCLVEGREDIRALPFRERRRRLERLVSQSLSGRIDLSPILPFGDLDELGERRAAPPAPIIEGVMLKRWDSAYEGGRPKGPWFKWKRDPYVIDAVLMYAQRGHGKRSSFYSDYTFGVWRCGEAGEELVPVGKAYFGFTDEELAEIDRFVRRHTVGRFGPVREVEHRPDFGLVFEVAFEGLNRSSRHRSGVAMRFPRISRLRWDKPPGEADRIEALEALLSAEETEAGPLRRSRRAPV